MHGVVENEKQNNLKQCLLLLLALFAVPKVSPKLLCSPGKFCKLTRLPLPSGEWLARALVEVPHLESCLRCCSCHCCCFNLLLLVLFAPRTVSPKDLCSPRNFCKLTRRPFQSWEWSARALVEVPHLESCSRVCVCVCHGRMM